MLGVQKNLNRSFARLSPVFVALGIAVAGVCGNPAASFAKAAEGDTSTTSAVKREAAGAQFARAEEQRSILNAKPRRSGHWRNIRRLLPAIAAFT